MEEALTAGRRNNDHYGAAPETWATRELLQRLHNSALGTYLEPCAGRGNIAAAIRAWQRAHGWQPSIKTNDIDPKMDADVHLDAMNADLYDPQPDWIVSNPPFNQAPLLVPIWVREARRGVAALLRLTFKEPVANRWQFLTERPPDAEFTLPRMSFTGDGKSDSVTCSWMIWLNDGDLADGTRPIEILTPLTSMERLL